MKALILAGGIGSRISRHLGGKPKCTVSLGNTTLIEYTINLLHSRGINQIALTLGYQGQVIKELLAPMQQKYHISYYTNPFFDVTNSIASAWFAKDFFTSEDTLIMNGDVFMEETILDDIIRCKKNPVLFADQTRKEMADYKFKYTRDGILEKYGKELQGDDISGEYIGIAKITADFIPTFKQRMEEMITTQQHKVWWENILYSMTSERPIFVEDVNGKFWAEVDYIEDYERIVSFVKGYKSSWIKK